ncbi:MAG: hypothetical protein KDC34_02865 [Saprospiraceae bacterium]|nr:hypothetical protein [Saprospiraceae bacterium]
MVAGKAKNLPALLAQAEQAGAVAALAAARLFNAAGGHDNEPKILKPFRNGYSSNHENSTFIFPKAAANVNKINVLFFFICA